MTMMMMMMMMMMMGFLLRQLYLHAVYEKMLFSVQSMTKVNDLPARLSTTRLQLLTAVNTQTLQKPSAFLPDHPPCLPHLEAITRRTLSQ